MKPQKIRRLLLILLLLGLGGGVAGYWILLNPGSIWVRWARAAFPARITMITFGPYPSAKELRRFSEEGGKYDVSLLDPRLPYEKDLIERERTEAAKHGLVFKDFPMASVFDHRVFSNYRSEEQQVVNFLKHLDGPAYVHCYLGKHRVIHVRNALREAGVPARYWTPSGSRKAYWDLVNRLSDARKEFQEGHYEEVISILKPVTTSDVDVSNLRGWSHYRVGMITAAAADFKGGLRDDPRNVRNLEGLGYCYLRQGNPVMAQRVLHLALTQEPDNEGVLVGLGLTFLDLRDKPAAIRMFERVLTQHPGNNEAKDFLKKAKAE